LVWIAHFLFGAFMAKKVNSEDRVREAGGCKPPLLIVPMGLDGLNLRAWMRGQPGSHRAVGCAIARCPAAGRRKDEASMDIAGNINYDFAEDIMRLILVRSWEEHQLPDVKLWCPV
jgi:hypothetical protein